MTASLLQNGKQVFLDDNGLPLAGGSVTFFVPNTTTPKDTYQNPEQTTLNTNPVQLDASGRAIIWGSGWYRQVVKDSLENVIWDQVVYGASPVVMRVEHIATGAPIGAGVSGDSYIDRAMEITKWVLLSTVSTTLEFDIWAAPIVTGAAPTVANSIVAADPPNLASAISAYGTALTGWTTELAAGTHIRFNVNSNDAAVRATLLLIGQEINNPP